MIVGAHFLFKPRLQKALSCFVLFWYQKVLKKVIICLCCKMFIYMDKIQFGIKFKKAACTADVLVVTHPVFVLSRLFNSLRNQRSSHGSLAQVSRSHRQHFYLRSVAGLQRCCAILLCLSCLCGVPCHLASLFERCLRK